MSISFHSLRPGIIEIFQYKDKVMTPEQAKDTLKLWGKIGIVLALIALFALAMDRCESKPSNESSHEWEEDDFEMQPVQKP